MSREINFDGLVGPTHHYAGLSFGNVASTRNAKLISSPKRAALQGLAKAAQLRELGLGQAILPPLRRPRLDTLRALGFTGTDSSVIEKAFRAVPHLVSACYSASSMWVANAATFTPSCDTDDGRAHFTVANLSSKFHRSLEKDQTSANLRRIFGGDSFVHHDPVIPQFGDEGAANYSRLSDSHGARGFTLFAFGGAVLPNVNFVKPRKFPSRQSTEASHVVKTTHGIADERAFFFQQNPDSIDAGVFHNDVVAVANENMLFLHEKAYANQAADLARLREKWRHSGAAKPLTILEIAESDVTLEEAIQGYLFNSQLVTLPTGGMALICPEECRAIPSVNRLLDQTLADRKTPIEKVFSYDVRESMQNGGGPACLRLRIVLTAEEEAEVHPGVWFTAEREALLVEWIGKHYRDRLEFDDLRDPKFYTEVHGAMDALEKVMGLPLA